MKFEQSFTVAIPRQLVWEFFETEAVRAGQCIPGVQEVSELGDDRYRLVVADRVGAVSVTFDLKAEIKSKTPEQNIELSAIGKSIKGARGDLRAKGAVELEDCEGGTQVRILADVVLGGMLGSLGHRVIVRRAAEVTKGFAAALAKALEAWNTSG